MDRFFMCLKIAFCCCLIPAVFTGITNILMDRFFMLLKKVLCSCIEITLVALIFHSFMFHLLMSFKTAPSCCLILAVFTGITNTFMYFFGVKRQTTPIFITFLTFLTRKSSHIVKVYWSLSEVDKLKDWVQFFVIYTLEVDQWLFSQLHSCMIVFINLWGWDSLLSLQKILLLHLHSLQVGFFSNLYGYSSFVFFNESQQRPTNYMCAFWCLTRYPFLFT